MSAASSDHDGTSPRRLPAGRKAELAAFVAEAGQVTVARLAEHFDVSTDTIRRDLDQLDSDGVLVRTHGGAVSLAAVAAPDQAIDDRMLVQASAKDRIGALAAELVENGTSLIINAGTTTLALARHLRDHRNLTITTNSLRLAQEIVPTSCRDLYVFGGAVRLSAQATIGPVSLQVAADAPDVDIQCDLALIAVGAVSVDRGYLTSSLSEAAMMSEMMDRASRVAVLADSSKFGRRLFARVADLGKADYLVTDAPPPPELMTVLKRLGIEVITP
jgi:DeoR family transcriptional regulator, fructose operon transcriptional repressor